MSVWCDAGAAVLSPQASVVMGPRSRAQLRTRRGRQKWASSRVRIRTTSWLAAMTAEEIRTARATRSFMLTIFWHCGFTHFSSRTGLGGMARQQTVNGFGRESGSKGSGNADSQLFIRSSGWSGQCRPRPCDSGCVAAHPAYRRAASYLPLRAGWAVCAWALRGCFEIARPIRAQTIAHH
jgi:hypothetical protein